ncbi:Lrp/AsnC family transcriptional regulator, partial [Vibrio fluvialis]|uniref:Lrp/AsnC family transcriptional regulator n=1 Tax=Vibrio fluvialis TaxID=676 RepID=UPI000AA7967D
MDKFDERILRELQQDGRISNVELAERVGLSPSATLRRVQELERKKVIKGYRAVLVRISEH